MRCLSEGFCQCQRILKLLTLRVIIVDRAGLHSPLMTVAKPCPSHVHTDKHAHNLSISLSNAHAQSLSSVCHYLLPSVIMLM